jgi:glutathione S-transferase
MKLYGALASPFVARAILFAKIKGVDLELAAASPSSAEYRAFNPIGKIPALEVDGKCIAESEVICEYIEDSHPTPSGFPADAFGRAQSRMVSRVVDLYMSPAVSKFARQVNPEKRDAAVVTAALADLEKVWTYLESFMGEGPFAVGDVPTLGDCTLAPYMKMTQILVFSNFAEAADPTETNPRLKTWWDAVNADPNFGPTLEEYGTAFEQMMRYFQKM